MIGIPFKYDSDKLSEQTFMENLFSPPKSTTGICSNGCAPTTVPYVETIAVQDDNVGVMPKAVAWLVKHTVANCFNVMAEQKCV